MTEKSLSDVCIFSDILRLLSQFLVTIYCKT